MKRFLFLVFIGFIALMIFMSEYEPADQPLPKKLEQAIKQTRMMEYHDDDYDYVVRHPQFFEQAADSLMDKGACRFTFWKDSVEVVQSAFVEPNADSLTTPQAVKKYTSDLHATCQRMADDFFDIFPLPFPVMPYDDDEDEDVCLITIGNDDCISYIPKNNSYEIFYKKRAKKLSDALRQYDIKWRLKFHHDNFSFYKENPDIYKIHLGIAEEYNKCIKII